MRFHVTQNRPRQNLRRFFITRSQRLRWECLIRSSAFWYRQAELEGRHSQTEFGNETKRQGRIKELKA